MTRIVKIKNCQVSDDTYCGQEIQAGQYYQLQETEFTIWAINQKVQNHLSADPAKIIVNNGDYDLNYELGKQHLEGSTPEDENGRPQFRKVVTKPAWYFSPHAIDFITSKSKSIYNRKHDGANIDDGTDAGDAVIKFYDSDGDELVKGENETDEEFDARLLTDNVKTIVEFEKEESYDIVGAELYFQNAPQNRAYVWCIFAPDIPYEYGGSKPFMGRGMALHMMQPKVPHHFDAVSTSTINYDPVNHSGKIGIIVKHDTGEQIGIQCVFVMYEE